MATVSNDERDNRPRLIYKPYAGKKGPEFEPWVVGFLDAAEGKGDDDASWADCYKGTDPQAGLTQAHGHAGGPNDAARPDSCRNRCHSS